MYGIVDATDTGFSDDTGFPSFKFSLLRRQAQSHLIVPLYCNGIVYKSILCGTLLCGGL